MAKGALARIKFFWVVFCAVLWSSAAAWTQTEAAPLSLELFSDRIVISIAEPTTLRTVLDAFCSRAQVECEIPPAAGEVQLAPMILEGTWAGVIQELMAGTGFNYASVAPAEGAPGRLLITERIEAENLSTEGHLIVDGSGRRADGQMSTAATSDAQRVVAIGITGEQSVPTADPTNVPRTEESESKISQESFRTMYGGSPALPPSGPLPVTAVIPFPDEAGNPVSVQIMNEPMTVLPLPGPDGEPIIIPHARPNTQLQYPIPPTLGRVKQ